MKIKIDDVKKAINNQFTDIPTSIKPLGDTNRPNSWTFEAEIDSKKVVIKVIKPSRRESDIEAKSEEEALTRLKLREDISAIRYISKDRIKIKGEDLPYFIFPFVEGPDLYNFIGSGKKLSEKELQNFLKDVTKTILQLASIGIIHQDIKPANIKANKTGYMLLDLGLARFIDYGYRILKQQGPAKYLSPEQVVLGQKRTSHNQRLITFLSDIYSSAVVALELLTGSDFVKIWETDKRHLISDAIRNRNGIDIKDPDLRERLASYLEVDLSKRLAYLYKNNSSLLSFIEDKKPGMCAFWNLHYKTTGTKVLTEFATENPDIRGGVVFLSEHIQSISNSQKIVTDLQNLGWKIAIDPSTYKLLFLQDHFADLKNRSYFREGLTESDFSRAQFTTEFVRDVLEFQKQFNPDFYISPYFFIEDPDGSLLDLNFNLYEEALRQLGSNKKLLLGLGLSKNLVSDETKLNSFLDQSLLYSDANAFYIKTELIKNNNAPCSDYAYLNNLLKLTKNLTMSKSILLSQVDQSCLGLFANGKLSISISSDSRVRKLDIQNKLSKKPQGGGPPPEERRQFYYIPILLNEMDFMREFKSEDVQKFTHIDQLTCKCKYCTSKGKEIDSRNDTKNRQKHFLVNFHEQLNKIKSQKGNTRKTTFIGYIDSAEKYYTLLKRAGILLSEESSGEFLKTWRSVFCST